MREKIEELAHLANQLGPKPLWKGYENLQNCYYLDYHESNNIACICSRQICFHWIPCALKYCKNRGEDGETTEHRCGIKTCQKCTTFRYKTKTKLQCLWDQ